ncbi:MAG: hypothetical protein WAJ94_10510 [Candidatus Cybelea sp.]
MKPTKRTGAMVVAACVSAAFLAGCAAGNGSALPEAAANAPAALGLPLDSKSPRCGPFVRKFDEYVACRRADGTLSTFADRQVTWRVRYYVRFSEMPCGEVPTVDEAYVFHMVVDDLNADLNITGPQRAAVRGAMYEGTEHCK